MSRTAPRRWVGIDGEGAGRRPHRYILLCASLAEGEPESISNPDGLHTHECLRFLHGFASRDVKLAGYYLSYDWTMMLRDLPNRDLYRLLRPELREVPRSEGGGFSWVLWRGWRLHFLGGAMHIRRAGRSITVWDIGKFYQQSFVASLRDWQTIPEPEIAAIEREKTRRSQFRTSELPRIAAYCASECRALARLAASLVSTHRDLAIPMRAWHGPGSTASAVLRQNRVHEHVADPPAEAREAVATALFGGRFEHSGLGYIPDAWGYDLANAYPYAMTSLPCLTHARWEHITHEGQLPPGGWAIVRARVPDVGPRQWGPLPVRLPSGALCWPRGGFSGWYWSPEYRAARAGWPDVEWGGEAWVVWQGCDCAPFSHVLPLYRERVALGSSARGRVLKIAMAAQYGQIARTIGHGGACSSRVWSGMIAAITRAQVLGLLAEHDQAVVAVACDGVYSAGRLDGLPPAPLAPDQLGAWVESRHGGMVFVRPGILYDHEGTEPVVRARGVGRGHLYAQRVAVEAAMWARASSVDLGTTELFGGARACIVPDSRGTLHRSSKFATWHPVPSRISLSPGPKRALDWSPPMLDGVESASYRPGRSRIAARAQVLGAIFEAMRG